MSGSGRRYEAVFWDIGGVIVELASVREGYAAFVAELADERGLDAESALETWKTALGEHFRGRDGTEYRTAREGYRKATAALFDGEPPDGWRDRLDRATSATLWTGRRRRVVRRSRPPPVCPKRRARRPVEAIPPAVGWFAVEQIGRAHV